MHPFPQLFPIALRQDFLNSLPNDTMCITVQGFLDAEQLAIRLLINCGPYVRIWQITGIATRGQLSCHTATTVHATMTAMSQLLSFLCHLTCPHTWSRYTCPR